MNAKLLLLFAILGTITCAQRKDKAVRRRRVFWNKKRAMAMRKKKQRAKYANNIQVQDVSMFINESYKAMPLDQSQIESMSFIEKLLHRYGVINNENKKSWDDVMTKRAKRPLVKLKSGSSKTGTFKPEMSSILAAPLYLTEDNYEVPATTKLIRTWGQKRAEWFPPTIYNRTWFFNQPIKVE
jgi:hypothetical protein